MNNDISPLVLLMKPKEQRKPTKKQIMKKVFIIKNKDKIIYK
jgi:hypothetical protein